jgi:hypothetical protein
MNDYPIFPSTLDTHTSAWGITLRDYIAIEMLKINVERLNTAMAIEEAFAIADSFIAYRGLK